MVISGGNFRPDVLKPKEVVSLLLDDDDMERKRESIHLTSQIYFDDLNFKVVSYKIESIGFGHENSDFETSHVISKLGQL